VVSSVIDPVVTVKNTCSADLALDSGKKIHRSITDMTILRLTGKPSTALYK
jgi:hypothetical protein